MSLLLLPCSRFFFGRSLALALLYKRHYGSALFCAANEVIPSAILSSCRLINGPVALLSSQMKTLNYCSFWDGLRYFATNSFKWNENSILGNLKCKCKYVNVYSKIRKYTFLKIFENNWFKCYPFCIFSYYSKANPPNWLALWNL